MLQTPGCGPGGLICPESLFGAKKSSLDQRSVVLRGRELCSPCDDCMTLETLENDVVEVVEAVLSRMENGEMECELQEEPTLDLGLIGDAPAPREERPAFVDAAPEDVIDLNPNKDKRKAGPEDVNGAEERTARAPGVTPCDSSNAMDIEQREEVGAVEATEQAQGLDNSQRASGDGSAGETAELFAPDAACATGPDAV